MDARKHHRHRSSNQAVSLAGEIEALFFDERPQALQVLGGHACTLDLDGGLAASGRAGVHLEAPTEIRSPGTRDAATRQMAGDAV